MAISRNNVSLLGNLGKDPEIRTTKSDLEVVTFSLATNESYNQGDKRVQRTEWHRCVAFGKKAKLIQESVKKGSRVLVEGKIRYSNYKDKNGIERLSVDIMVDDIIFLDAKDASQAKAA